MSDQIDSIRSSINNLESDVEQHEKDVEVAEQREQNIGSAMERLASDLAAMEALQKNKAESKAEVQKLKERKEMLREEHSQLTSQLEAQIDALNSDRAALKELEAIGEDVSESQALLDERQQWLERCRDEMEQLGNRLDIAMEAYDFSDSGAVGEAEKSEQKDTEKNAEKSSDKEGEKSSEGGDDQANDESDTPVSDFNLDTSLPDPVGEDSANVHDFAFVDADEPKLSLVAQVADGFYSDAESFSQELGAFDEYAEHKWTHIKMVYEKAAELFGELKHMEPMPEGYARLTNDDLFVIKAAALFHDTGMDGDKSKLEAILVADKKNKDEIAAALAPDAIETTVRKTHSISSALNVLKHRDTLEGSGVDADLAAIDCAIHSKKNSGVADLMDEQKWVALVNKISKSSKQLGISFNADKFLDENGRMRPEAMARCASHAFCMRVGDANGHDMTCNELQNGSTRVLHKDSFKTPSKAWKERTAADEAQINSVDIRHKDGTITSATSGPGKLYAMGEGNIRSMSSHFEGGGIVERIVVDDGGFAPLCTMFCVKERAEELVTAKGMPTHIRLDVDASRMSAAQIAEAKKIYNREAALITAETMKGYHNPIRVDVNFFGESKEA